MKSIVIAHPNAFYSGVNTNHKIIPLSGIDLHFGLLETEQPQLDIHQDHYRVLVKKKAFSCNFRDRACALVIQDACIKKSTPENSLYSGFGSEFVAEVIQIGDKVTSLKVGDKVIPNGAYPLQRERTLPGLPTNFASELFAIFDEEQLLKVPQGMPDEIAASLTIAGQTVYSMIRRANMREGQSVLITAASSNTSLFAMEALKELKVKIVGLTQSKDKIETLKQIGYNEVVLAPNIDPLALTEYVKEFGGFDLVIDPYFDLYLGFVVDFMKLNAQYVSCGLYRQDASFEKSELEKSGSLESILRKVVSKNLTIIGNCLGTTQDLEQAIDDVFHGKAKIKIDSIYKGDQYDKFIERSFMDSDRIGKVVYIY